MYDLAVTRNQNPSPAEPRGAPAGSAFLLAQVGAHAAARFAERLTELSLSPAHAGILRLVATGPRLNQREIAARLQAMPSRVVTLVDELETRGLVERKPRAGDRRSHDIVLTAAGRKTLGSLRRIATAHEEELTATLTEDEQAQLVVLLRRIADGAGLLPGAHPGYRR